MTWTFLDKNSLTNFHNQSMCRVQLCVSHRLLNLTAEDVDAEDLGVVVALGEGEAVALRRAVVAANTKEDFINGVVGNLSAGLRVQQPDGIFKNKML